MRDLRKIGGYIGVGGGILGAYFAVEILNVGQKIGQFANALGESVDGVNWIVALGVAGLSLAAGAILFGFRSTKATEKKSGVILIVCAIMGTLGGLMTWEVTGENPMSAAMFSGARNFAVCMAVSLVGGIVAVKGVANAEKGVD